MNIWISIQTKIVDPKYITVCTNIGGPLGLADDLYQEVMLTLCEKINSRSRSLENAFEKNYFDWYVIAIARNLFHYNKKFRNKYRWDVTGSVSFTSVDSTEDDFEKRASHSIAMDDHDIEQHHNILQACSDEFGKIDWYNYELFRLNAVEGNSIREIENMTGIPRTSIHQSIKATREALSRRIKETINHE